jgi:hypothetical protein
VRAAGKFTPVHDAWWEAVRRIDGDAAGTRALIEMLLLQLARAYHLPRHRPADRRRLPIVAVLLRAGVYRLAARAALSAVEEPLGDSVEPLDHNLRATAAANSSASSASTPTAASSASSCTASPADGLATRPSTWCERLAACSNVH